MTIRLDRRVFLSSAGAGLVLGVTGCGSSQQAIRGGRLSAWIAIAPDDTLTLRVVNTDMGQGAQTGVAQIVADEMDADWSKIRVEMAPVVDSYVAQASGYYTGGSRSIREFYGLLSQAGATARAMLTTAAANQWNVPVAQCIAQNGAVLHVASSRRLSFGALADAAARLPVPKTVTLKSRQEYRFIGRPMPRLDTRDKVSGRAVYGIDVRIPGMLVGTPAQCPYFGGKLMEVDEKPALAVPGVTDVVKLDDAVVVVARNFWTAKKGLSLLAPRWSVPSAAIASPEAMFAGLMQQIGATDSELATASLHNGIMIADDTTANKTATSARVRAAFDGAASVVEGLYQVPILSHSPIEPMNATAHVTATSCELWAPMQAQDAMRTDLAKALDLPVRDIVLHTTKLGGGFGRRLQTDYGVLAARVSRHLGKPVQVVWSREEDMTHDFYRPASIGRLRAALDADRRLLALDCEGATSNDTAFGGMSANYLVDLTMRQKRVVSDLPIGAWRSVDASITVFFLESLIDEIAHVGGLDPLDYRRSLLAGRMRELRVLEAVAQMARWGKAPAGRFQGLAFFANQHWMTVTAEIVELSVAANGVLQIHRVFCAIDPGLAVNPDQIRAQVEGGIILGLSAALGEEITLKAGRVEQTNFDTYSVLRLRNCPRIEVQILETPGADPGGIGEPPVPPIAPALANAVFAATGRRIRTLPLSRSGFSV